MSHCEADVICEDPSDHGDISEDTDGEGVTDSIDDESVADEGVDAGLFNIELTEDAEESSAAAVASLTERIQSVDEPQELDAFGLEGAINAFAAGVVAVAMTAAIISVGIRNWRHAWKIPVRYFRFVLVSLFGVSVSLGLWEVVSALSGTLAVIPEGSELQGNLWSNPFAGITIPLVEVLLDAQPWVVGFLIVSLPLAAAISIFGPFDRLIYIVIALVVANIIWLPLVVILTSRLLLVENAAHAGWWSLMACLTVLGVNGIAMAGTTSVSESTRG